MKRALAFLLVVMMLVGLFNVTAFATGDVAFQVDTSAITGELNPGDTISVPINITANPGVTMIIFDIDYSSDIFENVSVSGNETLFGSGTFEINGTKTTWEVDENVTTTGLFATVSLTVKDGASGTATISLKGTTQADVDITNEDYDAVGYTVTPGTVTIAAAVVPLSFTDGANTYDYATLHADSYSLTAPGAGYYFAGWFAGLTADGTKIVLEDGRYVLKSAAVDNVESFNFTETRPKYDAAPENGAYNALWVHENDVNPAAMVLEVYADSVTFRKINYTDNEGIYAANDVLRAAQIATNGTARVKLLKDLTVDHFGYKGSQGNDYLDYGLLLDLNGCTLTGGITSNASSYYSGGALVYFRDGTCAIDSSHGQGKLRQTLDKWGAALIEVAQWVDDILCFRDFDLEAAYVSETPTALSLSGGTWTLHLMDNVHFNVTGGNGIKMISSSNTDNANRKTHVGTISNCSITTNGVLMVCDKPGADLGTITNCTFTTTAASGAAVVNAGTITFGAGNTITTASDTLFGGSGGEYAFTADGTYAAAEGGQAFTGDVLITQTPVAGQIAYNDNGTLRFAEGFTLTYKSHDGSETLWADSYRTGETPVDNRTLTYPIDHVSSYTFDGWGTGIGTGVVDVTALSVNTTLYAQRTETTLPTVVIRTIEDGEPESFAVWEDALNPGHDYWGMAVTYQLQQDVTSSAKERAGYYKLTYDLNGHTLTYTGADGYSNVFYRDTYPSADSSLTITSTAEAKGVLRISNNTGLYCMATSKNQDNPLTLSNVRIEAPNLVSSGTGTSAYDAPNGLIYFFNSGTGENAINEATITNSELYAPQAPAIDLYIGSNNKNTKINVTVTNSSIEGGNYAVNIHGNNSANPVLTLTADKDSSFKNAACTDPIKTAASNLKLKTSYPTGYELVAIGDGWYGFELIPTWGEPTYEWAADNSTVTATREATNIEGKTETETVSATSQVTKAATCTEAGVTTWTSAAFTNTAFAVQTKTVEIEKIAHTPAAAVREKEVAATCETEGSYDEVVYCSVCNEKLSSETKTIPALGHQWGEWTVTTAATCDAPGVETRTCSRCDSTETRTIEASGHDWSEPVYNWSDDLHSVTATRACKNDLEGSHLETETVETTYAVTVRPTTTAEGVGTYMATFQNSVFETQTHKITLPKVSGFAVTVSANPAEGAAAPTQSQEGAVPAGTNVIITAGAANDGYEFVGWYQTNGKLVTKDESYTVSVYYDVTLEARYQKTDVYTITYQHEGRIYLRSDKDVTQAEVDALNPAVANGYEFDGWSMTVDEANAARKTGHVVVEGKAKAKTASFTVTIRNGDPYEEEVIECTESQKISRTAATVEGKTFSYWKRVDGGKDVIFAYTKMVSFTATEMHDGMILQAIYDAEDAAPKGTATMTSKSYNAGTKIMTFVAYLTVPDNSKIVKAGLVASNTLPAGGLTAENAQYVKNSTKNVGMCRPVTYTWNKTKVNPGDTWYARAYLVYTYQGETYTIYGDLVTYTAPNN